MIWLTWRQFRTQTWITLGGLAVLAVLLAITGQTLADLYTTDVAGCGANCGQAIKTFLSDADAGLPGRVFHLTTFLMYGLPALIGIFWGAPLMARELETGTHRLVWNQTVTRTRWLATKLVSIGLAAIAIVGVLSLAVTAWAHHIDHANMNRITPLMFGSRGIVPIGYAAFAFVVGVTAGMLIRRTVPAMAATLAVYGGALAALPVLRAHLIPAKHLTLALDLAKQDAEISVNQAGTMRITADAPVDGAWILSNRTLTPSGAVFTGPADPQYCGPNGGMQKCQDWLASLGLRQDLTYQPANHFWPLQYAETGLLLAVTAVLVGFCFWWTRRRLS